MQGILNKINTDFSSEIMKAIGSEMIYSKCWSKNTVNQ